MDNEQTMKFKRKNKQNKIQQTSPSGVACITRILYTQQTIWENLFK